MREHITSSATVLMLALSALDAPAQTQADFFDANVVHEIRLRIHPNDWQTLKDRFLENTYYPCNMEWRGMEVEDIGIRSRGRTTRSGVKPGLRVDFNRFEPKQEFLGLKSFILDNMTQDASMLKERVSMLLFERMGIPAPREAHARLYVNGEYSGLYTIVESIDKPFLKRHFGEDEGYLYEWNPPGEPYHFEYRGSDLSLYSPVPFEPKTHETDPDPKPLEAMTRRINQSSDTDFPQAVGEYLDLKLFMNHVATESFLAEGDGILGGFGMSNFYFYRFKGKTLSQFLPWDKDATFFSQNRSVWENANQFVLMRRALALPEWRNAYLQALANAVVLAGSAGGWLEQEIAREYSQIRLAAREDPKKQCAGPGGLLPCSNDDFENGVAALLVFARQRGAFVEQELAAAGFRFPDGAPLLSAGGAVNAAPGGSPFLAPGCLASIYGENLSSTTAVSPSAPLPTALDGVSILMNGFPAPLLFVSPTQVNLQVPWEVVPGTATVTGIRNGAPGNTITVRIGPFSPGIFVITHSDGSLISPEKPAVAGDVLVIYGTGLGAVAGRVATGFPAPESPARTIEMPAIHIGGLPAEVLFSGLTPGFVGLYQMNIRMPTGVAGGVNIPLVMSIGGRETSTTIAAR